MVTTADAVVDVAARPATDAIADVTVKPDDDATTSNHCVAIAIHPRVVAIPTGVATRLCDNVISNDRS